MAVIRRRITSLSEMLDQDEPQENRGENEFFPELVRRIRSGKVIPIVSNTICNESIFRLVDEPASEPEGSTPDGDPQQLVEEFPTVENELGVSWAKKIAYPLPDRN